MAKIAPDFSIEQLYSGVVVGVDEAGRGPWAGPVVAAAVNLKPQKSEDFLSIQGVNDSKKLSDKKRAYLYDVIMQQCDVGVGIVDVHEIDDLNILEASLKAMCLAVNSLSASPDVALVDGNQVPNMDCDVVTVVKGDSKSLSIAAASIIAKVTRDKIMNDLHNDYPHFAWDRNAGYGTALHREGLALHGVTKHHRKTFAPIRRLLANV